MATKDKEKAESAAAASAPPEDEGVLREKIKGQVEYYLSRQNLLQDSFLVSKMDKDHFVDLSVIAEFKLIKQLTTDLDLILASIKDSDKIIIDDAKRRIKPSTINQRTTLILRNIPTDAERNLVEALLDGAKIPKILNLRSDVGNNWFATFETEEATKAALDIVKTLKWGDKAIGVGIKSETGLSLGLSSAQGTPSSALPYYMPMNSTTSSGYTGPNGAYSGGDGHGHYRAGGRGGPGGPGGRRGAGGAGAGSGQGAGDGADQVKRQASKKGKAPKGAREARDGSAADAVRSGNGTSAKEAINLADFPVLEANPLKKSNSSSGFEEGAPGTSAAAAAQGKADNSTEAKVDVPAPAAAAPSSSEAAVAQSSSSEVPSTSPSGASAAPKKLSYAQMAQANASNAAVAAPTPQPSAAGQTASQDGPAPAKAQSGVAKPSE
mmetsp:Transcript_31638/g.66197  ORF Transcript_31638/g.66197 Transcript_31638/m.66197 type:complete len:437 (-) Transcript_31638:397-1707(-)